MRQGGVREREKKEEDVVEKKVKKKSFCKATHGRQLGKIDKKQ